MTAPGGQDRLPASITARELSRWARSAAAGERIVYARGSSLAKRPGSAAAEAWAMAERGEAALAQARRPWGFDYLAIRTGAPRAATAPERAAPTLPAAPEDEELDRVMRALRRAANFNRLCPSNAELARTCGLSGPARAKTLLRAAVERKLIRLIDRRPKTRVATILATHASTRED